MPQIFKTKTDQTQIHLSNDGLNEYFLFKYCNMRYVFFLGIKTTTIKQTQRKFDLNLQICIPNDLTVVNVDRLTL